MSRIRAFLLRVVGSFRPGSDAREEMEAHLALHIQENVRRGMLPDAARRDALLHAGGLTVAAENVHEQHGLPWLQEGLRDVRYALRALRHNPVYTVVAVITLALGVGANTAIFSVVRGVVLRPLPYPEPDRLVSMQSTIGDRVTAVSGPDFMDWRRQARSMSAIAASYSGLQETVLTGSGEPERLSQVRVSANTLDVLGVQPLLGRGFAAGEDDLGAPRVALVREELWLRRFGGDSSLVGRTLILDGFPTTVVGIAPRWLRWPADADIWMTTRFSERDLAATARGARWLTVLGRLRPGVSLEQAQGELSTIAARLQQLDPVHNTDVDTRVTPLLESLVGDMQQPLYVILGAVGFVLLIACANVASLSLGRIAARDAELAVRTALGASRFRIARQVLIENLVLAAFGGLVGTGVAALGLRLLLAIAPDDLPRIHEVQLDAAVLGFTLGLTMLAGILFGVMPAMRAAATGVHDRLRSAGRGTRGTRDGGRSRRLLVVTEVALAVVLVTGAGLLLRSFARLRDVDPGFRAEGVTTFAVSLPSTRYATAEQWDTFTSDLLARLHRVPGVSSAATSFVLPLSGGGFGFTFTISGRDPTGGADEPRAQVRVASTEYFQTMGIPLVRGRLFDERDRRDGASVLVISAELARRYFPGEDPIGRVLQTGWSNGDPERKFGGEIVGVVGDVRQSTLESGVSPHMYMSAAQWPLSDYDVVVRASTPFASVVSGARSALRELDPDIPLGGARPLDELVDGALGNRRFYLLLLGAFASVALALALVGIYGVMAYGVRLRRREIGVRLALGASRVRVVRMVLGDGLRLVMTGVVIGTLAAFALTRLLESLLYEVKATDPATFAIASLALMGAAIAACIVPARGASRLDPVETIRAD